MKEPIFNIIYIPDTVNYQAIALISLLLNSHFSFRLVGNSLKKKEAGLLKSIARCSDRLEFINFESDFIIPHGTLLDILFHTETSPYYCFCDSDLFLFNPLTLLIPQLLNDQHIFSSAGRIENDDGIYSGFKGGATTISTDGRIALATSFFAIYQRKELSMLMDKYKVGFEQYRQKVQVPVTAQKKLNELGLNFEMFDTGKLLSVLYYCHGYKNKHEDINGLVHLGGMSGRYLQGIDLQKTQIFNDDELLPRPQNSSGPFNKRNAFEMSLKKLYGKYFYVYLHYIIGQSEKPEIDISDEIIVNTMTNLEENIKKIFDQAHSDEELRSIITLAKEYK